MLDQEKNRGEPLPYLANVNVRWGEFAFDNLRTMRFEHHELERYGLKFGDIVMCEGGEPGRCAIWKEQVPGMMIQKALHRIRPKPVLDYQFLYYNLLQIGQRKGFEQYFTGATIKHLPGEKLAKLEVDIPPLPIQNHIVGILSAYDNLIENSQRRIRVLELIASALYREWFVHFRFPGYENHPRVASPLGEIPVGWEVKEMQHVAEVTDCLHSKKPSEDANGSGILLQLNNIGEDGKLDMSKVFRITADDYRLWTSRIELRQGDCVVTNVGRVGAVAQIPAGLKVAPGRNMTAIRARPDKLTPTFLIQYLLSSHMELEVAKKKDLGTIMDSLNVKGIVRLCIPCPPFATMKRYESVARPIRQRIELLVEEIQNLRRTRDLLLPRLLSGQIALDEFEAA